MRTPVALVSVPCLLPLLLAACTGLSAAPEVSAVTPVPASRDSTWVRAKRALTAESFTLDVQDSVGGRITAMRYPSATAKVGTQAACRVHLAMAITGAAQSSELASSSQWIAPVAMATGKPELCERDRQETMDRILLVVAPPPPAQ
jgi:hypothetical protein